MRRTSLRIRWITPAARAGTGAVLSHGGRRFATGQAPQRLGYRFVGNGAKKLAQSAVDPDVECVVGTFSSAAIPCGRWRVGQGLRLLDHVLYI
jgi:hypothetical protein